MKVEVGRIAHNRDGFERLVRFHSQTKECFLDTVEIDMEEADWFDADMCAPFGALLYKLGEEINDVRLIKLRQSVDKILSKNGFLSNFGGENIPDKWGTTIPYTRFNAKDDRYFAEYVESRLMKRSQMPKMSRGLSKKFREAVFEIFGNAVIHAESRLGIFSCGQFFRTRNKIDFTVADLGLGIRENIKRKLGLELSASEAIQWATEGSNTTKTGPIPGGLGLKLLSEFVKLNGGRLQIVSDSGYWCLSGGQQVVGDLTLPFPGTVVSLEIDAADKNLYVLESELADSDIF